MVYSKPERGWAAFIWEMSASTSAHFYFAQLKEACSLKKVENRGALMTKIFDEAATRARKRLR